MIRWSVARPESEAGRSTYGLVWGYYSRNCCWNWGKSRRTSGQPISGAKNNVWILPRLRVFFALKQMPVAFIFNEQTTTRRALLLKLVVAERLKFEALHVPYSQELFSGLCPPPLPLESKLVPLGTSATSCTCPGWLWGWIIWWNEDWQGSPKY
jgi:hypothetical protein